MHYKIALQPQTKTQEGMGPHTDNPSHHVPLLVIFLRKADIQDSSLLVIWSMGPGYRRAGTTTGTQSDPTLEASFIFACFNHILRNTNNLPSIQSFDSERYLSSIISIRVLCLGLGTEFRSEKIPRNGLGMVSVIPRKKVLIPKHSDFRGRANSEDRNGMERNGIPRKK